MTSPAKRALNTAGLVFVTILVLPLLVNRSTRLTGPDPSASGAAGWLTFALPAAALAAILVFVASYSWSVWKNRRSPN